MFLWCHRDGQNIIIFVIVLLTLINALTGQEVSCIVTDLYSCGSHEMCVQKNSNMEIGLCHCLPGYDRVAGLCVAAPTPDTPQTSASPNIAPTAQPHTDHSSKNAVVAGVLVPLLLICTLVAGLVYMGRRYNWLHRLRQLRPLQRTNDVLIGRPDDDDDPIA